MSMKFVYYGQNDGSQQPDVTLTGDPGVDQQTLTAAGYLGGRIMALKNSSTTGRGPVAVPSDSVAGLVPYGTLISGPGEFAGSIGPSGSGKVPIVRALPVISVDSQAFVAEPSTSYAVGQPLYCGSGASAGKYTADIPASGNKTPVGTILAVPSGTNPWLTLASLL